MKSFGTTATCSPVVHLQVGAGPQERGYQNFTTGG